MCLVISRKDHWFLKPKKAKNDIEVYKVLVYDYTLSSLMTPFQRIAIVFEGVKCEMNAKFSKRFSSWFNAYVVESGIHAYRNKSAVPNHSYYGWEFRIYKAIIPKGTKYYIGKYNDIVSEKLIIFDERINIE